MGGEKERKGYTKRMRERERMGGEKEREDSRRKREKG